MSLKAELETWAAALKAYDEEDFGQSLELFSVRSRLFLPTVSQFIFYFPRPSATLQKSSQTWVLFTPLSVSMRPP